MFHPDHEMDRVLVLHLVDVDRAIGPLARVGIHVGLDPDPELLNELERGVVRDHEGRRLPPTICQCVHGKGAIKRDVHRVTAAQVVDQLRRREQRVGSNDFHAVHTTEGRREQTELLHKQRLQ